MLTPNYLASEWTKFETLLLQTDDPANEKLRLLPILKTPCDIPKRLKILTYVDFTEPDDLPFAWTRLLTKATLTSATPSLAAALSIHNLTG